MPDRTAGEGMEAGGASDRDEPVLKVNARVLEQLPNALFRVELQTEARPQATVHVAASSGLLRILPGDVVVVEVAPYDRSRGRIVKRLPRR
jgi:translation initiation factor IF-1